MFNTSTSIKSFLTLSLSLVILCEAHAQGSTYVLQEGDNRLPQYAPVTATFTPAEDCKVLIEAEDQYAVTYNDNSYTFNYIPTSSPSNVCEIDGVSAGSTITLTSGFVMSPLVRITTFTQGSIIPLEIKNVAPATGTNGFWEYNGMLNVSFNKQVRISGAQIVVGQQKFDAEIVHVTSAVSINVGTTLNTLLADGTLNPGERFQVTINGVCEADNPDNLYNGNGTLNLRFLAPDPQYGLTSATVNGQELSTSGLNSYSFLSYYDPAGDDGLFILEFEAPVSHVDNALIQMGTRDLDAQGKYHESALPVTIDGNKVLIDARGTLRTLNILFPAVVEETPEEGESAIEGLGSYDREHLTLRVSNVIDVNGNVFRAQQAGNLGSYSFYLNYRELMETINLDGDSHMAGDEVVAGETISLWLSKADLRFEGIQITYLAEAEEDLYEPRTVLLSEYSVEPDPYEGVVITFTLPQMPDVAVGQAIRVSLYNASSSDGMPHDLSISFVAGDPAAGIHTIQAESASPYVWTLTGQRMLRSRVPAGVLFIEP